MEAPYFGLCRWPFSTTPDTAGYYPATSHERALDELQRGLRRGEGAMLVTGEPGSGKTLLGHCLIERLGPDVETAFLTNSHFGGYLGLFQGILFELSLPYQGLSEQEMRLALTDRLLTTYASGRATVLVVDEAHLLPADILEELRLLGNLEARGGKALQVVLLGQPALLDTLQQPQLGSLRQRLAVRCTLETLDLQEAADYVLHHLRLAMTGGTEAPAGGGRATPRSLPCAGRERALFSDEALQMLAQATRGVPRLLNQAAHRALQTAQENDVRRVDAEVTLEALQALGLELPEEDDDGREESHLVHPATDQREGEPGYSGVSFTPRRSA